MPSRFPKVFQKRKSSSDVLEGVDNPPVSSFRVLERPAEPPKSFEEKGTRGLRRPNADFRPLSEGHIDGSSNGGLQDRRSAGTQQSGSSYGAYNTSSSDRYSSSSTLPSAASTEGDDYPHPPNHPRASQTMPAGNSSGFLRNAGRKFSFGGKKSLQAAEAVRAGEAPVEVSPYSGIHDLHLDTTDLPSVPPLGRARAHTETSYGSETTVTQAAPPSKLELSNGSDDDGFGDIFAGIGEEKRRSQFLSASAGSGRPLTEKKSNESYKPYRPESAMPAPLKATRAYNHSPVIGSATSTDALMVASPVEEKNGVFEMGTNSPIETRGAQTTAPQGSKSPLSPSRQKRASWQTKPTAKGLLPRRDSEYFEDTDALLVSRSSPKHSPIAERGPQNFREQTAPPAAPRQAQAAETSSKAWAEEKPPAVPVHKQVPVVNGPNSPADNEIDPTLLNDEAFTALAMSADRLQARAPSPPRVRPAGKVMTPAQFEKYRRDKAQKRLADNDLSDSEDSKESESEEEEEDDQERHKRMAKQRQRQEAQLSVFRQSMMKTTGEQALGASSSLRPPLDPRASSRLSSKLSLGNLRGTPSPAEEDEDEDVPLGILAAHGFPSKEHDRAPNHERSGSLVGIQYNSETYPPPPAQSIAAGSGRPLPAFARKLPQDPFYGASLVNQTDRQSFALGGGDRGSVYGGSQAGGSQTNLHLPPPGGLVGVIASEERARAIRRGSPAKNFGFGVQDQSGSMPLPPGVGVQSMPMMQGPMMGPAQQPSQEQQANVQMAQQMTQMMQMQMQWMQQMMAMQQNGMQMTPQMMQMQQMMTNMQQAQGGMPGMQPPGHMGGQQSGRASTMMGNAHPNMSAANLGVPNQNGRAMSMMGGGRAPSMMMGGMNQGYTPSIAPSERSNIGQPSRYRPVSNMSAEARSRTQSFSSRSQLGFGSSGMDGRPASSGGLLGTGKGQVNVRLVSTAGNDEDEDAAWEKLRQKKESKKGLWRLRKSGASREKENVSPQSSQVSSTGRGPTSHRAPEGLDGVFVPNMDSI